MKRIDSNARLSKAVIANGFVFMSGFTAADKEQDVSGQTNDILQQIDKYLKEAGTDKRHLVSVNIWLKDIGDFAPMNEAWENWVDPDATPARATVQSSLARPEILVEMMAQAVLPGSGT
jgi:enamine deaminase RidA (YjgF/YER057c/UK114 family)